MSQKEFSRFFLWRVWAKTRLGLLLTFFVLSVHGSPVWISTSLPSSFLVQGGIDLTSDSSGALWGTFYKWGSPNNSFFVANTTLDQWSSEQLPIVLNNAHIDLEMDRLMAVDSGGVPHVLVAQHRNVVSASKSSLGWITEPLAPILGPIDATLAIDALDHLHGAIWERSGGNDDLTYTERNASEWTEERLLRATTNFVSDGETTVSMDTSADGTPFVCFRGVPGDPVRVLKKSPDWVLVNSFSESWHWPTLRVDDLNRVHIAMSALSGGTLSVRAIRMDSSGEIQTDVTHTTSFPGTTPPPTSLAIERDNRPHIAVGSIYISPSGELVPLPFPFIKTKIALAKEDQPFFLGVSTGETSARVTALLDPPGAAQCVFRTTHSLTWSFAPSTGAVIGYRLLNSLDGSDVSGLLGPSVTTFTQTGLSPNESQHLFIRALFPGMSVDSPPAEFPSHTLTVAPTGLSINRIPGDTISLSWSGAGNVSGTKYRIRLTPPVGSGILEETTEPSIQFHLVDPSVPYAVTVAAVNGDGMETFVSTLSHVLRDVGGTQFSFELPNGTGIDIALLGKSADGEPVFSAASVSAFPPGPIQINGMVPCGIGFNIPLSEKLSPNEIFSITVRHFGRVFSVSDAPLLARFDPDTGQWIPLATRTDVAQGHLTASSLNGGLFQIFIQSSPPSDVEDTKVFPNPFRPALHRRMAIQGVPAGTQVHVFSAGGQRVREFVTDAGPTSWDGCDETGNPVHSGVYVLYLNYHGETKRHRFVLER